jgi:hypothetical protein
VVVDERAKKLEAQIIDYMDAHHGDTKQGQARLVSSDVIESLFGQLKYVVDFGCLQEFGAMLLLLPLLVTKITADLVSQAMACVKTSAVEEWVEKTFGPSALTLRNAAFAST